MLPTLVRAQDDDAVERNEATVQRYYDVALTMGGHSADLVAIISPDYESPNPEHAPGLDAFVARAEDAQRAIASIFTAYRWVIDSQIGVEDIVATRSHLEAVTKDGKQGMVRGLEWTAFDNDGLIVETEAQLDADALLDIL